MRWGSFVHDIVKYRSNRPGDEIHVRALLRKEHCNY